MKVTLGIPTYNRLHYIKKMIESLSESIHISAINIRVYDDKSPEFDLDFLHNLFPFAREIIVRSKNLKADLNMKTMYVDFLNTDDDIFVNGDSDMIYRPGWLDFLLQNIDHTDGILSLYNSNKHAFISEPYSCLGVKEHVGAAGTAFKREIVEMIINEMNDDGSSDYDWKWSKFLTERNIRLFCSCDSYIQHIGIQGQNNNGCINDFDYGLNFIPISMANQKIMSEFLEEIFEENQKIFDNHPEEIFKLIKHYVKTRADYRIGHAFLALPNEIKRMTKKILRSRNNAK